MVLNMLALRGSEDADGRIWPLQAREPGGMLVEREGYDGEAIVTLPVTAGEVMEVTGGGRKQIFQARQISAAMYITDGRVVLACSKFDKGGGWVGLGGAGLAIALAANAVSKARAKARSKGRILAGQVRHQWLRSVYAHPKAGWASQEQLRLGYAARDNDGLARPYLLDVTLRPQTFGSMQAAHDIIHRAAAFRLEHYQDLPEAVRTKLTELAGAPELEAPPQGKFAGYAMPDYYFVTNASAFPPRRWADPAGEEATRDNEQPAVAEEPIVPQPQGLDARREGDLPNERR